MRKISLLLCLFSVILLSSCSEDPIDNSNEPVNPPLPVEPSEISLIGDNIEFDCNSNQYTFAVNANCDYDIIIPVDWISVINTKATHTDSLKLAIAANNTYYPRKCDVIIQSQDSKVSDTLHISQEEGFNSLAKALKADKSISLFYQALVMTGMIDSIRGYIDESFVSRKMGESFAYGGSDYIIDYLDTIYIKYTVFCETDSVLKEKYSISSIDDLISFSEFVYLNKDVDIDTDYTDRHNPLNQFVSYHILPMGISYEKLNPVHANTIDRFIKWNEIDFEDFYSPLLKHSLLKISTPFQSQIKYLNRKAGVTDGLVVKENGLVASNGYAYHLQDLLVYNQQVRKNVLNTRIRVLASTLFPEMMNNGGRNFYDKDYSYSAISFNDSYNNSYKKTDSTKVFLKKNWLPDLSYMDDGVYICSDFDFSFKLPPVPTNGKYEIRMRINRFCLKDSIQFYINDTMIGDSRSFFVPFDASWWVHDSDLCNDEDLMNAYDDSLRLHGYMKDVDSYGYSGDSYRMYSINTGRIIICSDFHMESDKDYYLRMRRLSDDVDPYENTRIDMIEIVPKSIYDGLEREDKN